MTTKKTRTYGECADCGDEEIEILADGLCEKCYRKRKKRPAARDKEHAATHKEELVDPQSETRRLRHQLLQHFQGLLAVLVALGNLVGSVAEANDGEPAKRTTKSEKNVKREEKEEIAETDAEDESEDEVEEED